MTVDFIHISLRCFNTKALAKIIPSLEFPLLQGFIQLPSMECSPNPCGVTLIPNPLHVITFKMSHCICTELYHSIGKTCRCNNIFNPKELVQFSRRRSWECGFKSAISTVPPREILQHLVNRSLSAHPPSTRIFPGAALSRCPENARTCGREPRYHSTHHRGTAAATLPCTHTRCRRDWTGGWGGVS